jgi:hypothetical protein
MTAFVRLAYGMRFRIPGTRSIYRKLDGVSFECIEDAGDRVAGFKAFDAVEIL